MSLIGCRLWCIWANAKAWTTVGNHLMASHRLKHSGQRSMTNMKSEMKYYNTLILMNGVFHDINNSKQSMTLDSESKRGFIWNTNKSIAKEADPRGDWKNGVLKGKCFTVETRATIRWKQWKLHTGLSSKKGESQGSKV